MSKPILFFAAGVISTLAIAAIIILPMWLLGNALDFSGDHETSYDLVKSFTSPDGAHAAIIYTTSGGGAAGWCFQRVAIIKKDESFDTLKKIKEFPFDVCSTSCRSSFELAWQDSKHLVVTYSFTGSPEYGDQIYQKIVNADKEIKISFASK